MRGQAFRVLGFWVLTAQYSELELHFSLDIHMPRACVNTSASCGAHIAEGKPSQLHIA